MSRKVMAIRNSVANLAYTVGSTLGIEVVFGRNPETNGKQVFLPDLPLDLEERIPAPYTSVKQCLDVIKGDVIHEGSHVDSTDFDSALFKELMGEEGLAKSLFNSIEDIRIERKVCERFAGARILLVDSVAAALEAGLVKSDLSSPGEVFSMYVNTYGSIYVNGQDPLKALYGKFRVKTLDLLGDHGLARVDALLSQKLRGLRTTDDAGQLTLDVLRLLKEIDEEQERKQPQQSQGNGQNPGNQVPTGGNAPGKPGSQGTGQGGQTGTADPSGLPGTQAGAGNGAGKGAGTGRGAGQILGDQNVPQGPLVDYRKGVEIIAQAGGVTAPPREKLPLAAVDNTDRYCEVRDHLRSEAAVLRSRMVNYFLSKQHEDVSLVTGGGKLHRKRMVRLALGDTRVFVRKDEDEEVNAALTILIDYSGSMNESRSKAAQEMMILIGEACRKLDVRLEILGFSSGTGHVVGLKFFETPYEKSLGRIGGYINLPQGGTDLGEGLMQAAYRLVERPEERKLLFALTDGDTSDVALTKVATKLIAREGVELVAFGIQSDAVRKYFPKHRIVRSTENLGVEVLCALRETLKRAA